MVPRELMPDGLTAVYGTSGELERVELAQEKGTRLIYIRFENDKASKKEVLKYAEEQADKMCAEIAGRKQKIARVFFGSFYDGQAVEIAVKTATEEEMKTVIEKYDGKLSTADNSGNYPFENAMMLDYKPFGVMLMCTSSDFRGTLFGLAAAAVEERIRSCILNEIDKTDDFKYISEEWD